MSIFGQLSAQKRTAKQKITKYHESISTLAIILCNSSKLFDDCPYKKLIYTYLISMAASENVVGQ